MPIQKAGRPRGIAYRGGWRPSPQTAAWSPAYGRVYAAFSRSAQGDVTDEEKRIVAAMQESLATFARLREQMREGGPQAVVASLKSMPDDDIRQILFALVVTTERVEGQG